MEQLQSRGQCRFDGVGRLKFDFHTGRSPRTNAGGGSATSCEGSKHRSRGAVSRVAGARHACFVLCSRKSHAPRLRSPLATRKWWFSRPGSRSWPPSQHRPRSVAAANQNSFPGKSRSSLSRQRVSKVLSPVWGRNATSDVSASLSNHFDWCRRAAINDSRPHLASTGT